jgi:FkbM family methyltransferase
MALSAPRPFWQKVRGKLIGGIPGLQSIETGLLGLLKLPWRGKFDYLRCKWGLIPKSAPYFHICVGPRQPFRLRRNATDIKIFEQIFLHEDCRVPISNFKPRATLDGGAHIGCTSVYFAQKYPESKIVAVEAARENYELLRHNTGGFPNIEAIHAAIFGTNGFVTLENPRDAAWAFRVQAVKIAPEAENRIPSVTIESLIQRSPNGRIDLLKLDIEGAEIEVFSPGAEKWLENVKVVVIELHDRERSGCSSAFESAVAKFPAELFRTANNLVWVNHGGKDENL